MELRKVLGAGIQAVGMSAAAADGTVDLLPDPSASPGITITKPGSYVLVDSVSMTQSAPAILIDADNVTLDLNGHTLSGPKAADGASYSLIHFNAGRSGLRLRNGHVQSAGTTSSVHGVTIAGSRSVLEEVTVTSCTYGAVLQGTDNRVENCTFSGNNAGMTVSASRNLVRNCQLLSSVYEGISLDGTNGNLVTGCRIEGNHVAGNETMGVFIDGDAPDNTILNNTLADNVYGLFVWSGTRAIVLGNQASANRAANFHTVPAALIVSLGSATAPPPATANVEP